MSAPLLVTGANGKTGRRVRQQLERAGYPVRAVGRSSTPVRFDWTDPSSYERAAEGIGGAYLVAPLGPTDLLPVMQPFIDVLLRRGTGRLVLLSAASLAAGDPLMGTVHAYLQAHAPRWAVLRPSWFMQNFSEAQHLASIVEQGVVVSATQTGRIGWIDAHDIAAVACSYLVDASLPNEDVLLTGPRALSYDEVVATIARASGRPIEHRAVTVAEMAARFVEAGLSPEYAKLLAEMDGAIARGDHDFTTAVVERRIGRAPRDFGDFVGAHVDVWRGARDS